MIASNSNLHVCANAINKPVPKGPGREAPSQMHTSRIMNEKTRIAHVNLMLTWKQLMHENA